MASYRNLCRTSLFASSLLWTSLPFLYADSARQPPEMAIDVPGGGSLPREWSIGLKQELSRAGDYLAGRGVAADPTQAA